MRINHRQFSLDGFQPDKAPDTLAVGAVSGGQTTVQTGGGTSPCAAGTAVMPGCGTTIGAVEIQDTGHEYSLRIYSADSFSNVVVNKCRWDVKLYSPL